MYVCVCARARTCIFISKIMLYSKEFIPTLHVMK